MALSNSQYNALMREYEQQQRKDRVERDARVQEVYRRIPQIEKLDQEIAESGAMCARLALRGDPNARETLKRTLADLREQKQVLLTAGGYPADYMEMKYRCPDCQDTGYARGHRCHCLERRRIQVLYAQSNIEAVLKRENFDTLTFQYYDDQQMLPGLNRTVFSYMQSVVRRCREFAQRFPESGQNILFTGSTGVGKTFLTNCIAKALMDRYVSVIYLSSPDLFEIFSKYKFNRSGEDDAEEAYRHILECEMLIIDDLGTEVNNTFVSSQLFYCINERINRRKGTIISTNLSMDMMRDVYSDRVTSRIMSSYMMIPLYGGDIRVKKRQSFRD